jgi:hypothetical protein
MQPAWRSAQLIAVDGFFMDKYANATKLISDAPSGLKSGHRTQVLSLFGPVRYFVLPVMAGTLGFYVVMHSPLRDVIAALLGLKSRACYFVCGDALNFSNAADSVAALILIVAASLAGWVLTDWIDHSHYERPLVFGLTAFAFVVVPAAVIGGIGTWSGTALLRPPLGPLLSAIPATLMVAVGLQRGWRPLMPSLTYGQRRPLVWLVGALATGLLLTSSVLSLLHPSNGGDALSYHAPLAVFLWRDGNLSTFLDQAPILWALAHPGTAELWYGLLLFIGGERLADLGQLPFALLGGIAVGVFTRRLGLGRGAAWLAAGAFLLAPMVVMQSTTQANDIVGTSLLMATIALACAPVATWRRRRVALLGLGLGLVATTKLALLPYVAGVTLFVIGATFWSAWRGLSARTVAARVALVAALFFTVAAPWWLRNVARYGNPVYPAGLPLIGRGIFMSKSERIDTEFVPSPAAWALYPLVEPHDDRSGFGALFAVGLIPGVGLALLRGRRQPLCLYGLMAAFMLPAWWELTLHEPRFLLAFSGLGCAFLPWTLLALPRRRRQLGGILLGAAALFSALVTVEQGLLPLARQPTTRAEFYDRVWGVDPMVASLPESEGLLYHTGYGPPRSDYAAYYALLGPSLTRMVIPVDLEGTVDLEGASDRIVASMRGAGVRYAYVAALPENRAAVETLYKLSRFELMNVSVIERGERWGARRHLYRPASEVSERNGIRRYLYRLR